MLEFNPVFDLSNLNGKNGFAIDATRNWISTVFGSSVSTAGDVNGDGIADIIIGAAMASPGTSFEAGSSYVIFGKEGAWNASLELSALDGQNGFVINGVNEGDVSGGSVSTAGDLNGDGVADIIIGAVGASPDGRHSAGSSYVVFGKKTVWDPSLELSTLNGQNGFTLNGIGRDDKSGYSVSNAGDINGDGIDDIIIGAYQASPGGRDEAGSSYVIFGKKTAWDPSLELSTLNGKNGFAINGVEIGDWSGSSVSTAGDVNGDGIADVIIAATKSYPYPYNVCTSYVVFGKKAVWNASLELSTLNGKNGFAINGVATNPFSFYSANTAGDINRDGFGDVIIGATETNTGAGSSYVLFGKRTAWNASLELSALNGKNGFKVNGVAYGDLTGISVGTAGDINGDEITDIIIGAAGVNAATGASYIIFGKKTAWNTSLDLSTLNGKNGFVIDGLVKGDRTGSSVSTAGDINGDGIADVLMGAPDVLSATGTSYVVFGQSSGSGFFSHRAVAQSIEVPTDLGLKP